MRANTKQQDKIKLKGDDLKDVKSFTYLGSIITESGGTEEDVKSRIGKARLAFNTLRPVWNVLECLTDFHQNQAAHLHYQCYSYAPLRFKKPGK